MTRLTEAALFGITILAFWYRLLHIPQSQLPSSYIHVQLLPIYGVIAFGAVSAMIVLYRVFTFNNCDEANTELLKQIKEAKQDLTKRGFVFRTAEKESKKDN